MTVFRCLWSKFWRVMLAGIIVLSFYLCTYLYILEAEKQEHINKASGEAAAMLAIADARAQGLITVGKSLENLNGKHAASLTIAEQYVSAFKNLAKTNNTLIVPTNASDVSSIVAQAFAVYKGVSDDKIYSVLDANLDQDFKNHKNINRKESRDLSSLSKINIE